MSWLAPSALFEYLCYQFIMFMGLLEIFVSIGNILILLVRGLSLYVRI